MNARQPDPFEKALPEHLQIARALKARDTAAAETLLHTYLENVYCRAQAQWRDNSKTEWSAQ